MSKHTHKSKSKVESLFDNKGRVGYTGSINSL